jgi:hypothetical protein
MQFQTFRLSAVSAVLGIALALPAFAQTAPAPAKAEGFQIENDATLKLGVDRNYRSSNRRSELTDGYGEAELVSKFSFGGDLSVQSKLHWERVKVPTGEDRLFGSHGLYVENLFANYDIDDSRVYAGKFNPNFGMGWDDARLPGFYANEFAKDYQMKEAIGAGFGHEADFAAFGKHKLDAALFFFDNTALSSSALNSPTYGPGQGALSTTQRPGRNRVSFGGPGNTSSPQSIALQYEVADPASIDGLTLAAGYRYLKAGSRQPTTLQAATGAVGSRNSHGYVAGARYEIALPGDVTVTPFLEWAKFTDVFNADPNIGINQFKDRSYLTSALIIGWGDFTLVGSRMTRTFARPDNENTAGAFYNQEDRQVATNLLYKVMEDLTLGIGYRKVRAVPAIGDTGRQATTESLGIQAVYLINF